MLRIACLLAIAGIGCASGQDIGEVMLTIHDEPVTCERSACVNEAGRTVQGELVQAPAILSGAGSRLPHGMYVYVGTTRADGRFLELEIDLPTDRTGAMSVEADLAEFLDGNTVYRSERSSGQVRLVLGAQRARPPAGRFDLFFRDGAGLERRVIGRFARDGFPPVPDRPLVDEPTTEQDDDSEVFIDYEEGWDVYVDHGCGAGPAPDPDPGGDAGGCEGDSGGDSYDSDGGCEGDAGGDEVGSENGCEGDIGGDEYGSEGGCEGDSGGGSYDSAGGCEGDGGGDADCSVVRARRSEALPFRQRLFGRLLPYVLVTLGLALRRSKTGTAR